MELTDVVSRPYSRLAVGSSLIRQLLVRKQAYISFAYTKIILARAIFDEIHGVLSNFLHVCVPLMVPLVCTLDGPTGVYP